MPVMVMPGRSGQEPGHAQAARAVSVGKGIATPSASLNVKHLEDEMRFAPNCHPHAWCKIAFKIRL